MFRRLVKVSAAVVGAGTVALMVAGCGQVKMGSAAIVGDQRITIATLDTEVANLSQAAEKYPATVHFNQAQMTQQALNWLIRFEISEELARQAGITVTDGEAQQALDGIYAQAQAQAQAAGVSNLTRDEFLALNGIPPNKSAEAGRYLAIYDEFAKNANGGTVPAPNTAQANTVNGQYAHAACQAAKSLNISVNPQFGQLDYSQLSIVPAQPTVWRSPGPVKATSSPQATPAC